MRWLEDVSNASEVHEGIIHYDGVGKIKIGVEQHD